MNGFGPGFSYGIPIMLAFMVWSVCWKGVALWRAGRKNQLVWFIALLVLNTLGILEILYIFVFSKEKKGAPEESAKR